MKLTPALVIAVCASTAHAAAADPVMCSMVGMLARSIAVDRENGVPYKAEVKRIAQAVKKAPNERATLQMSRHLAQIVYVDMPRLSPDGAYKLAFVSCDAPAE
jgi:hypothetical protein